MATSYAGWFDQSSRQFFIMLLPGVMLALERWGQDTKAVPALRPYLGASLGDSSAAASLRRTDRKRRTRADWYLVGL